MADCHPELPHQARGFCAACYQKWWHEQNPGRLQERLAKRRPASCHPDRPVLARDLCGTCYRRQWRLENPGKEWVRQNHANKIAYGAKTTRERKTIMVKRYGLTIEQYEAMVEAQGGACAVCGTQPKRLQIDHCHTTGKVRSLLCPNCNSALAHAKESEERLLALIAYLRQHA